MFNLKKLGCDDEEVVLFVDERWLFGGGLYGWHG